MRLLILILFFTVKASTQNLVLNSSFEKYSDCPDNISQLNKCDFWSSPTMATTDYFNPCSNNFSCYAPFNAVGKQKAHTGNSFIGIITMQVKTAYHEMAQGVLCEPMIKGNYYKVSFYMSVAEISRLFLPSIGVYFSTDSISINGYYFYTNSNQKSYYVNNLQFVSDNNFDKWVQVTGTYKARGGEKFILLGVRSSITGAKVEKNKINEPVTKEKICYYFIDDVSVELAKNKKDMEFDKNETISSNEIITNKTLYFAKPSNIFKDGSSDFLNIKEIINKARKDTGFVPEVLMIQYLGNFMYQNPSVTIELRVCSGIPNEDEKHIQVSQERANNLVKKLKKYKVSPSRIIAKGYGICLEKYNIENFIPNERIEFTILTN